MNPKICDFCNKPVLPAFERLVIGEMVSLSMVSPVGQIDIDHSACWLACGFCFDLIRRGYWESLINRVMRAQDVEGDKVMELLFRVTYSKAFDHPELLSNYVSSLRQPAMVLPSTL
jgi:hypothetical protein